MLWHDAHAERERESERGRRMTRYLFSLFCCSYIYIEEGREEKRKREREGARVS